MIPDKLRISVQWRLPQFCSNVSLTLQRRCAGWGTWEGFNWRSAWCSCDFAEETAAWTPATMMLIAHPCNACNWLPEANPAGQMILHQLLL